MRIAVVTGTRAEYGLLRNLMRLIADDADCELLTFVTGSHLTPDFGMTVDEIEADGFRIDRRVDIVLAADSDVAITKSMGLALIGFGEAFAQHRPDMVVVLGDRYEIFCAASAALVSRIPIAHLHGGEVTAGAYDEAFRHSITKMAALHFTSTEDYRRRVIQLGEQPEHVYNVGAPGLDEIRALKLLSRAKVEERLGFKLREKNILVTFHPATLEVEASEAGFTGAERQFNALLYVLKQRPELGVILTYANADAGGRRINALAEDFAGANPDRCFIKKSLGQTLFLSTLQYVDAMVGNSSSGIIEAPSFRIATINIGERQAGRVRASTVIDCAATTEAIEEAFGTAFSPEFAAVRANVQNPHGDGRASEKIFEVLKAARVSELLQKRFCDL